MTGLILPGPNKTMQPNESRGLEKETRTTEDDDIVLGCEGNTQGVSCRASSSSLPSHSEKHPAQQNFSVTILT